jgi:hypothetical protein
MAAVVAMVALEIHAWDRRSGDTCTAPHLLDGVVAWYSVVNRWWLLTDLGTGSGQCRSNSKAFAQIRF